MLLKSFKSNAYIKTHILIAHNIDSLQINPKSSNKLDSIEKANNKSVIASGSNVTKAYIFLKNGDSTISLTANIRQDHRIFGYSRPDIKSKRLLLLSVFTDDVENNPFGCKLGSYYDTSRMDDLTLKYLETLENFVKAVAIDKTNHKTILYFEKKWIVIK